MRIITLLMLGWVLGIGSAQAYVVFIENFQGGIPASWTIRDLDGNTHAPSASYFTNAWISLDDPLNTTDKVAASNSWYTPPGTSNDWLITPPINLLSNCVLKWEAKSLDNGYRDSYTVLISTTNNATASFTDTLFSVSAENSLEVIHSVDLQALGYANQTVYIAFVNNSNDKFTLTIDDVVVYQPENVDLEVTNFEHPMYRSVPLDQWMTYYYYPKATIRNHSNTNTSYTWMKTDAIDVNTGSVISYRLTPGAYVYENSTTDFIANLSFYIPTVIKNYGFFCYPIHANSDVVTTNDTAKAWLSIHDSVLTRSAGTLRNNLSIGAGNGGFMGNMMNVAQTDTLTSITFTLEQPFVGDTVYAGVFKINSSTGLPDVMMGQTVKKKITTAGLQDITLPMLNGSVILPTGDYLFAVAEGDSNLTLVAVNGYYVPRANFVDWPTNPYGTWASGEDFNMDSVVFAINANFGPVQRLACPGPPTGNVGYSPDSNNLPCIIQNQAYMENVQFELPSSVNGLGVNWVRIDSIVNMPCGITYSLDRPDRTYNGGTTGCITFSGLTSDAVGQYRPSVMVTVSAGSFTLPGDLRAITQQFGIPGFSLYLRVKGSAGASCPNINGAGPNLTPSGVNCPYIPPQITITANPDTVCAGSPVTLTATVTQGTGNYGYFWTYGGTDPTQTFYPTGNTTYELAVVDGNSTVTETVNVYVFPPVPASAGDDDTICTGSSAVLFGSGGVTYAWSPATGLDCTNCTNPAANPTVTTTYHITVTDDNGCTGTDSMVLTVEQPVATSVTITANDDTICAGPTTYIFTATPANGGGTPSYTWLLNGFSTGNDTNSIVMSNLAPGDEIQCFMSSSINCVTVSPVPSNIITAVACGTVGVVELPNDLIVRVMPNPSTGKFNVSISGSNEMLTLEVMTMHGQRVWTNEVQTNGALETAIDLTGQSAGIYILVVKGREGTTVQKLYKSE